MKLDVKLCPKRAHCTRTDSDNDKPTFHNPEFHIFNSALRKPHGRINLTSQELSQSKPAASHQRQARATRQRRRPPRPPLGPAHFYTRTLSTVQLVDVSAGLFQATCQVSRRWHVTRLSCVWSGYQDICIKFYAFPWSFVACAISLANVSLENSSGQQRNAGENWQ